MSSPYCRQNLFTDECLANPNYVPPNNPLYTGGVFNIPSGQLPSSGSGGGGNIPTGTITGGGATIQATKLDKILQGILSGFAIFKGASYVPTTIQPQQQQLFIPPEYYANMYGGGSYAREDGTAAGKVENWIKENTGVVLIGGAIAVAYLMRSPRQR